MKPSKKYGTIKLKIPPNLIDEIKGVTETDGTWQRPYQRIKGSLQKVGDDYFGTVRDEDIKKMKEWAVDPGEGSYERWAAEILKLNSITPDS